MLKRLFSLTAALCLSLGALLLALLLFGCSASRFTAAQQQVGLLPQDTAAAFSQDTLAYLCGSQEEWHAEELLAPYGYAPSEAFALHMAEVRGMVQGGKLLLAVCLLATLLMLILLRLKKCPIIPLFWRIGALLPLFICSAAALWCVLDFEGFWYCFHKAFIPNGIFSSAEPIMALFPAELFAAYAPPIVLLYLILALLILLAPGLPRLLRGKERKP